MACLLLPSQRPRARRAIWQPEFAQLEGFSGGELGSVAGSSGQGQESEGLTAKLSTKR